MASAKIYRRGGCQVNNASVNLTLRIFHKLLATSAIGIASKTSIRNCPWKRFTLSHRKAECFAAFLGQQVSSLIFLFCNFASVKRASEHASRVLSPLG